MTRMHAGFTGVVQHEWPRPRGWAPPQRLDALDVHDAARASARRSRSGCARSASSRCATCSSTLPVATRARSTRSRSRSSASAEGEVAIEGRIVSARARPLRGRRTLVTAIVRDVERRPGQRLVLQPAVARREAGCGNERAAARQARPLRLRREELRHRRGAPDGRLRARLSGQRADPVDAAARARAHGARAVRAQLSRPAAGRARARAAPGRARRDPFPGRRCSRPSRLAGGSRSTSS